MLSKLFRFHSRGGVNYTYKKGRQIFHSKDLTIIYNPNPRHFLRFAVVVSKKVEKTAVLRNRIRRRIYEAIRLEQKENLNFPKTGDFLIIVHSKIFLSINFFEIRSLLKTIEKV